MEEEGSYPSLLLQPTVRRAVSESSCSQRAMCPSQLLSHAQQQLVGGAPSWLSLRCCPSVTTPRNHPS